MKKVSLICAAACLSVLAMTGCSNMGKPPVDKQRAQGAIKSIQADPHMLPAQKAAMIAEIQKQIN